MCSSGRSRKYIGLRHETGVDSKIRFSIEPLPGDDAFNQWKDGMKAVAGLPMGIPADFRKKVWLALADNYLNGLCIDWEKTVNLAFNRRNNPDDNKLGLQIVKDLHRTGSSMFSGQDSDEDRAMLERILLAYARWNKQVGYCQGFNVIAAMILDVMDRQEDCALKVMIFLIDRVLPEGYFANNLRALSVDMAVFRDLLRSHLPRFSRHLDWLQTASKDQATGASYEPPLTNVFTMQWFLTLFATCLPKSTALRVWDAVLLEGSEILLRSAIAVWGTLQRRLSTVQSADEFYTTMGVLSQEMLTGQIIDEDELIEKVYEMGAFPMPGLAELRDKYTNIVSPFAAVISAQRRSPHTPTSSSDGGANVDYDVTANELIDAACLSGMFPPSPQRESGGRSSISSVGSNVSAASNGVLTASPLEMMARDVDLLDEQYRRLKERQKQAHVILAVARQHQATCRQDSSSATVGVASLDPQPIAVNHLFVGREMMNSNTSRNRAVATTNSKSPSTSPTTRRLTTEPKAPETINEDTKLCSERLAADGCKGSLSDTAVNHTADILSSSSSICDVDRNFTTEETSENVQNVVSDADDTPHTTKLLTGSTSMPVLSDKTVVTAVPPPADDLNHCSEDFMPSAVEHGTWSHIKKLEENRLTLSPPKSPKHESFNSHKSHSISDFGSIVSRNPDPQQQGPPQQHSHVGIGPGLSLPKVFNPFPKQYVNKRRTQNGIRLGLYTSGEAVSTTGSDVR
jgi:hypothetical protein